MVTTHATLTEALTLLETRLNDTSNGDYTDTELTYCLNLGYRETQIATGCNRSVSDTTLVAGTATYDVDPIYQPLQAYHNGVTLQKVGLSDMAMVLDTWGASSNATPTKWMPYQGSIIRVNPPPSSAAVSAGHLYVYGLTVDTDRSSGSDQFDCVPAAHGQSAILDRAEAEARKMRLTHSGNPRIIEFLMQSWRDWCAIIKDNLEGDL